MSRYQLVGKAARYQNALLADPIVTLNPNLQPSGLWPGPAGWPLTEEISVEIETKTIRISDDLCIKRHGGKTKVQEEGHCRLCRRTASELADLRTHPDAVRLMTRHHLVPRAWWRKHPRLAMKYRDVDANVVPLCVPCHRLVETELGTRRMLRHAMTQAEVSFVIQVLGVDWLESEYPLRSKSS